MWVYDIRLKFDDLPQESRPSCWRKWDEFFKREEEEPETITEVLTLLGDPDYINVTDEGRIVFSWNDTETYIDGYESLVEGFRMMLDNSF